MNNNIRTHKNLYGYEFISLGDFISILRDDAIEANDNYEHEVYAYIKKLLKRLETLE